jgi:hypothetical protein
MTKPDFRPSTGTSIGFDLALSHFSTNKDQTFSKSLLGLSTKLHYSPKGWGVLKLVESKSHFKMGQKTNRINSKSVIANWSIYIQILGNS